MDRDVIQHVVYELLKPRPGDNEIALIIRHYEWLWNQFVKENSIELWQIIEPVKPSSYEAAKLFEMRNRGTK